MPSREEAKRLTVPATMTRLRTLRSGTGAGVGVAAPASGRAATPAEQAAQALRTAAIQSSPPDTILPGSMPRPDNLLPRPARAKAAAAAVRAPAHQPRVAPTRGRGRRKHGSRRGAFAFRFARRHWRRLLVIAIVGVALTMSLIAVWPVAMGSDSPATPSVTAETRATGLLRTVVGGGRTLFAPRHSFAKVSPAQLSARSYHVPVVTSGTAARVGQVSMRVTSTSLTLATAADGTHCVFARDAPGKAGTLFATVHTTDCRAAAAPAKGWAPR